MEVIRITQLELIITITLAVQVQAQAPIQEIAPVHTTLHLTEVVAELVVHGVSQVGLVLYVMQAIPQVIATLMLFGVLIFREDLRQHKEETLQLHCVNGNLLPNREIPMPSSNWV